MEADLHSFFNSSFSLKSYVSQRQRQVLRHFQQVDVAVHRHFSRVLQRRINQFGRERMRRSVLELRRLNEEARHTYI